MPEAKTGHLSRGEALSLPKKTGAAVAEKKRRSEAEKRRARKAVPVALNWVRK